MKKDIELIILVNSEKVIGEKLLKEASQFCKKRKRWIIISGMKNFARHCVLEKL